MEQLDPRKHDVRDLDWGRIGTILLPYTIEDFGKDDRLPSLESDLVKAVKQDGNQECLQNLTFLAIHDLCKNPSMSGRPNTAATNYIIELLERVYRGEEPNQVFRRNKRTRGPNVIPKHEVLLNVAIPESRRRKRKEKIQNQLKTKSLSRRERDDLEEELSAIKIPSHIKRNTSKNDGDCEYYSESSVRQIMKEYEPILHEAEAAERRLTEIEHPLLRRTSSLLKKFLT